MNEMHMTYITLNAILSIIEHIYKEYITYKDTVIVLTVYYITYV